MLEMLQHPYKHPNPYNPWDYRGRRQGEMDDILLAKHVYEIWTDTIYLYMYVHSNKALPEGPLSNHQLTLLPEMSTL